MNQTLYNTRGIITEIQRFSVHDGPGIRTLVFLKGCPLRCKWCCNPETQVMESQNVMDSGDPKIVGKTVTVAEIMEEVRKDSIYYRRSGGGITLSGGEVLAQPDFARAILEACSTAGINTAIETSGFANFEIIESLIPFVNLFLYDVKHIAEEKHKAFTGQSNSLILSNLKKLGEKNAPVIVRIPVIPTFNHTSEEIGEITKFAASVKGVKEIHLLPYHRLGESKYRELDRNYEFSSIEPLEKEEMENLLEIAQKTGLHCQIGG
ncbi:glycyl-radical enzyme activating protein [Aminipila luticellarii]|uniref:Glycyl-radical enzyme activating protein n=1 Tax=Aminipila luticellarii TaxID=2507160 RepID=A0A410PWT4_9FIRM|nr:glycyl-radical enzyme activating protein [Aminipila luticellarii]QAT43401.1 glycyl-radical enzyme activating protein [Aminipila luticellarii]